MKSVFFAMLLICGASYSCALSMRKKIDAFLTSLLFFSVFFLYIFYIFDILLIGKIALTAVYILLFLGGLIHYILISKSSFALKTLIKDTINTVTPAFIIFILGCVASYFITKGAKVHLWDELRLWGAFPKILHFTHKLQLGPNVLSFPIMQSYPPAMPLFAYYLAGFSLQFNEASIFMGYAIFCLAILAQAFRGLSWTRWYLVVPATLLILSAPTLFYAADPDGVFFFRTLFIDPVLGVVLGYLFYLATAIMHKSRLDRIEFLLLLFITIILKDSGVIFALLFSIILFLRARKKNNWDKSFASSAFIAFFVCAITFLSWKMVMKLYYVNESIPLTIQKQAFDLVYIERLWSALKLRTLFSLEHIHTNLQASFIVCMVILGALDRITLRKQETLKIPNVKGSRTVLFLSFCIFIIGYYALYPSSLASFERYMGTILTCYLVIVLFGIVSVQRECRNSLFKWRKVSDFVMPVTVCIILLIRLFNYSTVIIPASSLDYGISMFHAKHISEGIDSTEHSSIDPAKVYLVIDGDPILNSQIHHRIYFDLIGTNAYVGNFYPTTDIVIQSLDDYSSNKLALSQKLINDEYDYIYMHSVSKELDEQFADWNNGNPFRPAGLYKINAQEAGVILDLVHDNSAYLYDEEKEFLAGGEFLQTIDLAPYFDRYGTKAKYRLTFEIKSSQPGDVLVYQQNGSTSKYSFQYNVVSDTEYSSYSLMIEPVLENASEHRSMLAFYAKYGSGVVPTIRNIQFEILGNN